MGTCTTPKKRKLRKVTLLFAYFRVSPPQRSSRRQPAANSLARDSPHPGKKPPQRLTPPPPPPPYPSPPTAGSTRAYAMGTGWCTNLPNWRVFQRRASIITFEFAKHQVILRRILDNLAHLANLIPPFRVSCVFALRRILYP